MVSAAKMVNGTETMVSGVEKIFSVTKIMVTAAQKRFSVAFAMFFAADKSQHDISSRIPPRGCTRAASQMGSGIGLGISAFTDRDRECLKFALENGVDAVSQSFVEGAADLHAVREAARELGHEPFLIAKIERSRALDRLDEILDAADGIMISRGDLGVEVPIERIAVIQKDIMRRANQHATDFTDFHGFETYEGSLPAVPDQVRRWRTGAGQGRIDGSHFFVGDLFAEAATMLIRLCRTKIILKWISAAPAGQSAT